MGTAERGVAAAIWTGRGGLSDEFALGRILPPAYTGPDVLHRSCHSAGKFEFQDRCWQSLSRSPRLLAARALAKLREADVAALAEFQSRGDQNAVDVDAGLALKLEEHVHDPGVVCAAAQHPAATAEDRAGEGLDEARRLFGGDGPHLHCPGKAVDR